MIGIRGIKNNLNYGTIYIRNSSWQNNKNIHMISICNILLFCTWFSKYTDRCQTRRPASERSHFGQQTCFLSHVFVLSAISTYKRCKRKYRCKREAGKKRFPSSMMNQIRFLFSLLSSICVFLSIIIQ